MLSAVALVNRNGDYLVDANYCLPQTTSPEEANLQSSIVGTLDQSYDLAVTAIVEVRRLSTGYTRVFQINTIGQVSGGARWASAEDIKANTISEATNRIISKL